MPTSPGKLKGFAAAKPKIKKPHNLKGAFIPNNPKPFKKLIGSERFNLKRPGGRLDLPGNNLLGQLFATIKNGYVHSSTPARCLKSFINRSGRNDWTPPKPMKFNLSRREPAFFEFDFHKQILGDPSPATFTGHRTTDNQIRKTAAHLGRVENRKAGLGKRPNDRPLVLICSVSRHRFILSRFVGIVEGSGDRGAKIRAKTPGAP